MQAKKKLRRARTGLRRCGGEGSGLDYTQSWTDEESFLANNLVVVPLLENQLNHQNY
jgi:hypothetical protein